MKKSRRVISIILCLVMTLTTFCGVGVLPSIKADAANTTLTDGTYSFTQERVVTDYATAYPTYETTYLNSTSSATELVLPGLNSTDNYIPQGMTYYAAKNWVLISAYSNGSDPTAIFALDADSGEFVNAFLIKKESGVYSTSHGGGLTVSENNLYFADSSAAETNDSVSNIAYIPLSQLDVEESTVCDVQFKGSIDLGGELGGAATSYCCFDEGILWVGNFYRSSTDYDQKANSTYPSLILGYKLSGNSSDEEWANLAKTKSNLIKVTSVGNQTTTVNGSTMSYEYKSTGDFLDVFGNVSLPTDSGSEAYVTTGASVTLTEGTQYTIEYDTNTRDTDIYLMGSTAGHCNTKNFISSTPDEDGYYHCKMTFVAGVNPGADSSWPATLNGDETEETTVDYSGSYSLRIDQDNVTAAHDYAIKNLRISTNGVQSEVKDCATVPSYCIATKDFHSIQYATVDNGRFYLSSSWGRTNESTLIISEIDLSIAGSTDISINGAPRKCYIISDNDDTKSFKNLNMSEALCIVDDYLYMTFEGAANKYKNGTDNLGTSKCNRPVDVVWKIDQYALIGEDRPTSKDLSCYERVYDLNDINAQDEYLIVYESDTVDSETGNKNIYALTSFGGYNGEKLPKSTQANGKNDNTLDSMGVIPQTITQYHRDADYLYLENPSVDDGLQNRWKINGAGTEALQIKNRDIYYNKYNSLYFGSRLIYMTTDDHTNLSKIKLAQSGDVSNGDFNFYYLAADNTKKYYLWCNDGSNESYMDIYNTYYSQGDKYVDKYTGLSEIPGTFHGDGQLLAAVGSSGNQTGSAVDSELMNFHIYRRVTSAVEKTGGSGLYNTLGATLQADGTYTVNMQSYATGSTHQYFEDKTLPTDFLFLFDASASMEKNSDSKVFSKVIGGLSYNNTGSDEETYILYNGNYYRVWHISKRHGTIGDYKCWIYITVNGQNLYLHDGSAECSTTNATTGFIIEDGSQPTHKDKKKTTIYYGEYYTATDISRLQATKDNVKSFVNTINENAQKTGTKHRVGLIQFGSTSNESYYNTGYYTTDSTTFQQYSGDVSAVKDGLSKVFYDTSHTNFTKIVDNITSPNASDGNDADTYVNHAFEMATEVFVQQSPAYGGSGDKYYSDWTDAEGVLHKQNAQAVVILITDGIPGVGNDANEANTVANKAIASSKVLKDANAVVYSVQIGYPTLDNFNQVNYIEGVSSDYPDATDIDNLGTKKSSDYSLSTAASSDLTSTVVPLDKIFTGITDTTVNTGTSITLDTNAILQQTLADEFMLTDNSKATASISDIYTNAMGNTAIGDPVVSSDLTVKKDVKENTVTVSGFDYAENYFTTAHDGKVLNVEITGVLLNPYTSTTTMDISKESETAIYENQEQLDANNQFRGFPNVNIDIVEKQYVLDYGVPMVRSTSSYGKPVSIDYAPNKQDVNNYTTALSATNGTKCSIQGTESITAQLTSTSSKDTVWVLYKVTGEDGYEWAKVNIMPASNVLYEETSMATGSTGKVQWSTEGASTDRSQAVSTSDDVYGYDASYAFDTGFSNGSAYKATVSDSANRTDTKTFTFTGDSFDLISACGSNTGILLVSVKNAGGKVVKGYIVDTYYRDNDNLGSNGLLSQTPVAKFEGDYGTYTVEVTGAYLSSAAALQKQTTVNAVTDAIIESYSAPVTYSVESALEDMLLDFGMEDFLDSDVDLVWFDSNSLLNGGDGVSTASADNSAIATQATGSSSATLDCYIDGIRIYNPLGDDTSAYNSKERDVTYYNVIDNLKGSDSVAVDGFAFVESPGKPGDGETLDFAKYQQYGPKNEFYLTKSSDGLSGLTFNVQAQNDSSRVMLGLRSVSGSPVTFKVNGNEIKVTSATEMYYDITECLTFDEDTGIATVTVVNESDSALAINNVKISGAGVAPVTEDYLTEVYDLMTAPAKATTVVNGTVKVVADDVDNTETPDESTGSDTGSTFDIITMIINIIKQVFESLFKSISLGEVK